MTTQAAEVIREAIQNAEQIAENTDVGVQPAVLMNKEIDHDQVAEYQICHFNDSWADKIKGLMDDGFVVYRIQTEFGQFGHSTMAYLAKMKAN